jgi:uncharacterized protein YjdB
MNFKFKLSRRLARMKVGAVIAGTLAVACSLSSSPTIARVDAIQITPRRLSLVLQQAANLQVVVVTSRGVDSTGAAASLQWSTTGGSIANGGVIAGAYSVTYTSPSQPGTYLFVVTTSTRFPADTATVGVSVTPVPVGAVTVTPGSVSLAVGDTARFHASLTDSTGAVVVGRSITWSSSDSTVVLALGEGFVRTLGVGTATIRATSEGRSGSATVTVH